MSGKDSELNTRFILLCFLTSDTMSPVPAALAGLHPRQRVKITHPPFEFVSVRCLVIAVRKADGGGSSISYFLGLN